MGLMDVPEYQPFICGEESFGTGSSHVREKDGLWAVLAWLSIIAYATKEQEGDGDKGGAKGVTSIESIIRKHWGTFGRRYYTRFDYEGVEKEGAVKMMAAMVKAQGEGLKGLNAIVAKATGDASLKLKEADEFSYTDPITGAVANHQGIRYMFEDGSRIIFRLSGTGSVGATVRMYLERTIGPKGDLNLATLLAVKPLVDAALALSGLEKFTGRKEPTVIT